MGDSTAGQQLRSFNCVLDDHLTKAQQESRYVLTAFSWKAFMYNDTVGDHASSETIVLDMLDLLASTFRSHNQSLVVVMAFGAWYIPHATDRFANEVRMFNQWWHNLRPAHATLIWRDVLPQHFVSKAGSGLFDSSIKPSLKHNSYDCHVAKSYCRQVEVAKMTRGLVAPAADVFALPVFAWAGAAEYGHNIRSGDCTHFCIPVMAVWNILLVRLFIVVQNNLTVIYEHALLMCSMWVYNCYNHYLKIY